MQKATLDLLYLDVTFRRGYRAILDQDVATGSSRQFSCVGLIDWCRRLVSVRRLLAIGLRLLLLIQQTVVLGPGKLCVELALLLKFLELVELVSITLLEHVEATGAYVCIDGRLLPDIAGVSCSAVASSTRICHVCIFVNVVSGPDLLSYGRH